MNWAVQRPRRRNNPNHPLPEKGGGWVLLRENKNTLHQNIGKLIFYTSNCNSPYYYDLHTMVFVFLDIDGVCHPLPWYGQHFRKENMAALARALSGLPVNVVITSTWRESKTLDELKTCLGIIGEYVLGVTPVINDLVQTGLRHAEIELYWESLGVDYIPWVAVDDMTDYYRDDAPLILTDASVGFTETDAVRLRQWILQNSRDDDILIE
jgi:hypothetical protein